MNTQNVAPTGAIGAPMTAPSDQKQRRDDVQLLPAGPNVGLLYALVELGTHMKSYNNQPAEPTKLVHIRWEHPQLKQLYYVDDTKPRSATSNIEPTYSLADRAKLRALVHIHAGRAMDYAEANRYDLSKLLGMICVIDIQHKQSKDGQKFYENVNGFSAYNQNYVMPVPFEPEEQQLYFYIDRDQYGNVIGNNFMTTNYAMLPGWMKKKILASQEAIAYQARGGRFAELPATNQQGQAQQGYQQQQQPMQTQQQFQQPQQTQQQFQQPVQQQQQQFQPQQTQQNFQQQPQQGNAFQTNPNQGQQFQQQQQQPQQTQQQAPQGQQAQQGVVKYGHLGTDSMYPQVEMLVDDFSIHQYLAKKWTLDGLVREGKARWNPGYDPAQQNQGQQQTQQPVQTQQFQQEQPQQTQQFQQQAPQQTQQQPQQTQQNLPWQAQNGNNSFLEDDNPNDLPFTAGPQ